MESEFLEWLVQRIHGESLQRSSRMIVDLGDDGAVVNFDDRNLVVVSDGIASETHFRLGEHPLSLIGRKAMAVNLSDMAAMGSIPGYATVNFQLPESFDVEMAKELYLGLETIARDFETLIVGGDTNVWSGGLVVGVTLMGWPVAKEPWRISGATPGDSILVSGNFGGSIHGKHLTFTPQVALAKSLAEKYQITSATDVSDSLSVDLNRLLVASGVGAAIELDRIPVSPNVVRSDDDQAGLSHALSDGEDFELILTMSPHEFARLEKDECLARQLTWIGTVGDQPGLYSTLGEPVEICGYRH